jgi:FlaA1/EpsC-like NDP-sugar epimerase
MQIVSHNISETDNPLIMRAAEDMLAWDKLKPALDGLSKVIVDCDQEKLRSLLIQVVLGFKSQCDIADVMYSNI